MLGIKDLTFYSNNFKIMVHDYWYSPLCSDTNESITNWNIDFLNCVHFGQLSWWMNDTQVSTFKLMFGIWPIIFLVDSVF